MFRHVAAGCSAGLFLLGALDAHAQTAAAGEAKALEEIVVTAERRETSLQNTAITISAFNGETLAKTGISDSIAIQQLVPGLVINKNFSAAVPFLRGVGSISSGTGAEMSVATYLDGFYIPNPASGLFALNNVERVEVLKGPQGTLFGRNASGGVIQVVTRDPSHEASVDASASYANYDTSELNFYGTTGLTDSLAVSLAGNQSKQGEGWGRNLYTGKDAFMTDQTGLQAKLKWTPAASTTATLSAFYNDLDSDVGANFGIFPGQLGLDGTPFLGRYTVSHYDTFTRSEQWMVGLRIDHDLGWANLASLTGYHHLRSAFLFAQNGIVGQPAAGRGATNIYATARTHTLTQELQLLSKADAPFEWIVGAFYLDDVTAATQGLFGTCVDATCAPTPVPLLTKPTQDADSIAGFGQATFDLFEATHLTLGLRYTRDRKSLSGTVVPFPGQPNTPATVPTTTVAYPGAPFAGDPDGIPTHSSWPKGTWRITLDHDFSDAVMGYVSYNRGFKSGVYNIASFGNIPARPEVLDAYEAGVKSELLGRTLRLNAAVFYYDFKDIQLRTSAPPAPVGQTILYNAAQSRIKGVDVDLEFAPVSGLTLSGGVELLDAEYTEFPGGACIAPRPVTGAVLGGTVTTVCDRSGATLIRAPKVSAILGVDYTLPTSVGSFSAAVKDTYTGSFFWDPSNRLEQDAYHYLNVSLTWTAPRANWDVQLFARNLLDEFYYTSAFEGGGGNDTYSPGDPRTYGIKVGMHY